MKFSDNELIRYSSMLFESESSINEAENVMEGDSVISVVDLYCDDDAILYPIDDETDVPEEAYYFEAGTEFEYLGTQDGYQVLSNEDGDFGISEDDFTTSIDTLGEDDSDEEEEIEEAKKTPEVDRAKKIIAKINKGDTNFSKSDIELIKKALGLGESVDEDEELDDSEGIEEGILDHAKGDVDKFYKAVFGDQDYYFYTYGQNKNQSFKTVAATSNSVKLEKYDFSVPNKVVEISKTDIPDRILKKMEKKALEKNISFKNQ
jgi:hypothetical protein